MKLSPFLLCFLLTSSLFGVYIGNPAAPSIMNTGFFSAHNPLIKGTTGYIADYITDKLYEPTKKNSEFDPEDTFRKFMIHSQLASFSVIILERLEVFGTLGGSKPRAKLAEEPENTEIFFDFEGNYQFSWSTGAKIVLIQWGQTFLSTDFTYFAMPESTNSYVKFFNRLNLPIDFEKQPLSMNEWQLSLGLSSRIFFLTPYAGCSYLNSKLHIAGTEEIGSFEYKNKYNFGYFYGITASVTGRFHFNFEQRFRDEKAYTFSTIAVF